MFSENLINQAIRLRLLGCEPVVTIGITLNLGYALTRVLRENVVQLTLGASNLASRNLDIRSLALNTTEWLVNHNARMLECLALASSTCCEEHRTHRCRHTCTDSRNIAIYQLHSVVDAKTCRHATTRSVDIYLNILEWVYRLQEEELCLDDVCHIVGHWGTQEEDTLHHQTAEYIELRNIQLTLLQYHWIDVGRLHSLVIVKAKRRDAAMAHCKLFKLFHFSQTFYNST